MLAKAGFLDPVQSNSVAKRFLTAKIASSSAPGTSYSALAGTMKPESRRNSRSSKDVSSVWGFSTALIAPRPITLVLDNARYQRCAVAQALARSLKIELLFLPSYSPNLNLIERLWKFIKKECLAARYRATYEDFTAALDDGLAKLHTKHKAKMDTLLTLNFQTFDDVPILTV